MLDNPDRITKIVFRYVCESNRVEDVYSLNKGAGERQQHYLWRHRLRFSTKKTTDERWHFKLDEFAAYIMRKTSRFHELSGDVVPEDTLHRLRQQVAERQAARDDERGSKPQAPAKKGLFKGFSNAESTHVLLYRLNVPSDLSFRRYITPATLAIIMSLP